MKEYELYKRNDGSLYINSIKEFNENYSIRTPAKALEYLRDIINIDSFESEHHYLACFDEDRDMVGYYCSSIGDYNKVDIYERKIVSVALLMGAKYILTFHNHPNNNAESTVDDMYIQSKINAAIKTVGVEYFGEHIVGKFGWKRVGTNTIHEWEDSCL